VEEVEQPKANEVRGCFTLPLIWRDTENKQAIHVGVDLETAIDKCKAKVERIAKECRWVLVSAANIGLFC
jgi:hypothetical protein